MMLSDCTIHPKLETIQYLDFSIPGALPWESLIARIREIETDVEPSGPSDEPNREAITVGPDDSVAKAILAYLNQRGYQMVSFDRLRQSLDRDLTDERLTEIITKNPNLFRRARLRGDRPGIAKLIP